VFRHNPKEPNKPGQATHAGLENINAANPAAADAEALVLTDNALARSGLKNVDVTVGDLSIFSSLLEALGLTPQRAERLRRHVWRPAYLNELLKRLTGEAETGNAFLAHVGTLPPVEARAVVQEALTLGGIKAIGTRTIEEITDRFLDQAPTPVRACRALSPTRCGYLDVKVPACKRSKRCASSRARPPCHRPIRRSNAVWA
jgi:ATP phosphoribosyltransferase regulatory subunit